MVFLLHSRSKDVDFQFAHLFLQHLNASFRAVAAALDDPELPVRVNAALAITELVTAHEAGSSMTFAAHVR